MTHETRIRHVEIPDLSLTLTGASVAVSKQVAAELPAAINAALGGHPVKGHPYTGQLAEEIAGRIRAGLSAHSRGDE